MIIQGQQAEQKIRKVFGGQAKVTPVRFNATADEIREIKNLPDSVTIGEPDYTRDIDGVAMSELSLMLKIDPTKQDRPSDAAISYVDYKFVISKDYVVGKVKEDTGYAKTQILDNHAQNGWLAIPEGADVNKVLHKLYNSPEVQLMEDDAPVLNRAGEPKMVKICPTTKIPYSTYDSVLKMGKVKLADMNVRKAKYGEVALYDLLFNMSNAKRYKQGQVEAHQFILGDNPHESFDKIVDGDVVILNQLIKSSTNPGNSAFLDNKKEQRDIMVLLGGKIGSDGTKIYQSVYTPNTHKKVTVNCTARSYASPYARIIPGTSTTVMWSLDRELLKQVKNPEYPWNCVTPDNLEFGEVKITPVETIVNTVDSNTSSEEDDLPF